MRGLVISICLLSLWIVQVLSSDNKRPVVDTPSGQYRGHILKTRYERDVLAFQGIPYALPPIGELRFKDPIESPKLDGIYEANNENKICFQPSLDFTQFKNVSSYVGSEDCLYLNVYKPKIDKEEPLPVLVWIHGGAFMFGSGSTFWNGPEYFLDKDMILVTMNYRLGILGFLSTGDSVIKGNYGLKDQVLALKWVKKNIASFGGDPNSVTIGGISAGGSSVSLLMHSPQSKGLFHRAIAHSGTAHSSFATVSRQEARNKAEIVASYLGCSFEPQNILKCLQKMSLFELFNAAYSFIPEDFMMAMDFVPVIEESSKEAFLPYKSINEPSDIPFLVGTTNQENLYVIRDFMAVNPKYKGDVNLVLKDVKYYFPFFGGYRWNPDKDKITQAVANYYFGGENGEATEEKTVECFSDLMFNHALYLAAKKEKGPTYLFIFSYKFTDPLRPPIEGLEGVSHGEDCLYFFNVQMFAKQSWSKDDLEMSNKMVDMWYNFIAFGNPTPDSKLWEESERGVKYMDITNEGLHMKSNIFQPRMEFLDQLAIDRPCTKYHDEL